MTTTTATTSAGAVTAPSTAGKRIYNFSAGPAVLPEEVIRRAQNDLWNIAESGIGFVETSIVERSDLADGSRRFVVKSVMPDVSDIQTAGMMAGKPLVEAIRTGLQSDYVTTTDEIDVIVATVAFGMGIDKSNVRFVAHLDMPPTLQHYYQETGRAGRDGLPSNAWLAYGWNDVMIAARRLEESGKGAEQQRIGRHVHHDQPEQHAQRGRLPASLAFGASSPRPALTPGRGASPPGRRA